MMQILVDAVNIEVESRRVCDEREEGEQEPRLAHGAKHVAVCESLKGKA